MKQLNDLEIIESIKKGNLSDYNLIINKYKSKAFSLLKRMLKNEMDAEEVLQDCFIKAYYNLNSFQNRASFSTWFYRIVYNTALSSLNSKKRQINQEMTSIDDHYNLEDTGSQKLFDIDDYSINKYVESLPPKYSAVINMFYLDELKCEEIADIMNTTVANVKVLLHRSRNMLRDILSEKKIKD